MEHLKVTRRQVIARGMSNRCPNCGRPSLFPEDRKLKANRECRFCGLKIDRGEGFFLGSMTLNYLVTVLIFITPIVLLAVFGLIGTVTALVLAGVTAIAMPLLLYRRAWSWWLMVYYFFLPHQLPSNASGAHGESD